MTIWYQKYHILNVKSTYSTYNCPETLQMEFSMEPFYAGEELGQSEAVSVVVILEHDDAVFALEGLGHDMAVSAVVILEHDEAVFTVQRLGQDEAVSTVILG